MTTDNTTTEAQPCICCTQRPAGHGHFGWYCAKCAEQPVAGCSHERVPGALAWARGAITADQGEWLSRTYPEALPLLDNGWTMDAALNHVQGSCDRELCTGDHA